MVIRGGRREIVGSDGRRYPTGKNPVWATVLSVIPGLGQLYNGDVKKGLLMLGLCVFYFAVPALILWSMIDAYRVAAQKAPIW